jgi:hypothetical protein
VVRLALVTDAGHPDLGGEAALLLPALGHADIRAEVAVWDDPSVDWSSYDGVAIRSTWDYTGRVHAFRDWIHGVAEVTRLANRPDAVVWNTDKRYLSDLAVRGVAVIDTVFVAPGAGLDWPPWPELVVKPAVSAGARRTRRFDSEERVAAAELVDAIHAEGHAAMVQPYIATVDTDGEFDVVVLGGRASHAVRKAPVLSSGVGAGDDSSPGEHQPVRSVALTADLVDFAAEVLAAVPAAAGEHSLLQARVDSVMTADGTRQLMELELVEPFLFLAHAPEPTTAAERYASAARDWLNLG